MNKPLQETRIVETECGDYSALLDEHYEQINEFLLEHLHVYPKANSDWNELPNEMKALGLEMDPMFGKCFHSAKFMQYFGGSKDVMRLMLIKAFPFCSEIDARTTHWFVKRVSDGKIFDPTARQFMYDVDINNVYRHGKPGDLGFPYFYRKTRHIKYNQVVPNVTVLELGRLYKERYGTDGAISWWRKEKEKSTVLLNESIV